MAEDENLDVVADIVVNDAKAGPALSRITSSIGKLANKFDGLTDKVTSTISMMAGFSLVFGFSSAVDGAKQYIDQIDRLNKLTGLGANRVAGIAHAFEESGVEAEGLEKILGGVAKKTTAVGMGNKTLAKMANKYGVDLREGPEKSLSKMADLVQKNKVGAGEVQKLFGVSGKNLASTMDLLRKGGKEVNRLFEDGRQKNKHLTDETVAGFDDFADASHRVGMAWRRIMSTVIVKIAPALTKLADFMVDRIDGWANSAAKFGNFLSKHMDSIVASAKVFGKVMAANYVLMKLTGDGLAANMVKFTKTYAGKGGASKAAGLIGSLGGAGGGKGALSNILPFVGKFGSAIKNFGSGAARAIPMLMKAHPIMFAIGIAVALIAANWKSIAPYIKPALDSLSKTWDNIKGIGKEVKRLFVNLGSSLGKVFGEDSIIGKFFRWIGRNLVTPFNTFFKVIEKITEVMRVLLRMLGNIAGGNLDKGSLSYSSQLAQIRSEELGEYADSNERFNNAGNIARRMGIMSGKAKANEGSRAAWREYESSYKARFGEDDFNNNEQMKKLAAKYGASGAAPSAVINQDFRGSRFDITQAFSDGFDPDRVAVAFANDLSGLGERQLQSGFSPMFTVR